MKVPGLSLARAIRADFERHGAHLLEPGGWTLAAYRLEARAAQLGPGVARAAACTASRALAMATQLVARTTIAPGARIGAAFHLIHARNVTIADGVEIGDRVGVMHEVTIGPSHQGGGAPRLGHDVFVGAGAAVLGPITIGDGAMIAANSLVVCDVPPGTFAVGVPAKIVRWSAAAAAAPSTGA
jgi:serine O-acetyltransferase